MRKQKGFTLIELLIVIAIIGIIAAIAIPNLLNALDRSRQKRSMADLRSWGSALGTYLVDFNFYPYWGGVDEIITTSSTLYLIMTVEKYLENPPYQDGWNFSFRYTGGANIDSAWGYTIASLGKGNTAEIASTPDRFRCFQCDIRLRNGQFWKKPEGPQEDRQPGCDLSECR